MERAQPEEAERALGYELLCAGDKMVFNPFALGDFAEKSVLRLVEWFSGHCRAIKS